MKFKAPLIKGKLIKRYKRFLADIDLECGSTVTAHCANSGSMKSVKTEGATVWISPSDNPKRKLKYTWEIIEIEGHCVGINTSHPNQLVSDSIRDNEIPELTGYDSQRREVRYGQNSRIDILLESNSNSPCYVEVKNVTMKRTLGPNGIAEFPDAVTARGAKHLREMTNMVKKGNRAVMFYLVQRDDCPVFKIAGDIDPEYEACLAKAIKAGVEVLCYSYQVTPQEIRLISPVTMDLPN